MQIKIRILLLAVIVFCCGECFALFERNHFSARASGMGGAFSAIATDLNALVYNPAGLALLAYPQISFSYSDPFSNFHDGSHYKDNAFLAGMPLKFSFGRNRPLMEVGSAGLLYRTSGVNQRYKESTFALAYAVEAYKNLYAGLKFNLLSISYNPGYFGSNSVNSAGIITNDPDPLLGSKKSKSGSSLDASLYYVLDVQTASGSYDRYCFSLFKNNITASDMSLGGDKQSAPERTTMGLGYYHRLIKVDFDYTFVEATNSLKDNIYAAGIERWFSLQNYGRAALRSGLSVASRSGNSFSLGTSYLFRFYVIDYAFVMPLSGFEDIGSGHYVNFTLRFGHVESDLEPNPILQKKIAERRELDRQARQLRLDTTRQKEEVLKLERELESAKSEKAAFWGESQDRSASGQNSYNSGMDVYKKMVNEQRKYTDRQIYLEGLIKNFQGRGIDISEAERELEKINRIIENGKENLALNWSYYQRLGERGADRRERKRVLLEMKRKFDYLGLDMKAVDDELEKVEREMYR